MLLTFSLSHFLTFSPSVKAGRGPRGSANARRPLGRMCSDTIAFAASPERLSCFGDETGLSTHHARRAWQKAGRARERIARLRRASGGGEQDKPKRLSTADGRTWSFCFPSCAQARLAWPKNKRPDPDGLSLFGLRSEADSNRCSSFCRAVPSHSATRPFGCRAQI